MGGPKKTIEQLRGDKYNRLTIVDDIRYGVDKRRYMVCRCDCGDEVIATLQNLKIGRTKSCGCYNRDRLVRHGLSKHPLFEIWTHMVHRCEKPYEASYQNYGGRGISVCDEWKARDGVGFQSFYDWAVKSGWSEGLSIERVDVDGNYEPSNCCWIPLPQQAWNKRLHGKNTTGVSGVRFCTQRNKYKAFYSLNGKKIHLGYFDNLDDAARTRKDAERKYRT